MVVARKPRLLEGGDTPMSASKRFGKYKEESKGAVRERVVDDDPLKLILGLWREYDSEEKDDAYEMYFPIAKAIGSIEYSTEDIMRFCASLSGFIEEKCFGIKAGVFLSALMNAGSDSEYVLDLSHVEEDIESIGLFNEKRITLIGDFGNYVGDCMRSGSLRIKGNVEDSAGFKMEGGEIIIEGCAEEKLGNIMRGGSIHVMGCCGNQAGNEMKGGEIIVEEDVYGTVGNEMKGGTITINGDMIKQTYRSDGTTVHAGTAGMDMEGGEIHLNGRYYATEANVRKGRIYHKGKLIVDK
jgi:formylmethanofuran dehydrogenase subunit C